MAIKYLPYTVDPLRGQAVLPFLRYHSQLNTKDFVVKGLPYYEVELIEEVNGGGENLVIQGDCLNACAYLKEKNIKVDLVYIDHPFASGANYAKKIYLRKNPKLVKKLEEAEAHVRQQRAEEGLEVDNSDLQAIEETMYGDIWQKEDYLNWLYERLLAIKEIMSDKSSIYVHLDWHIGHYVKVLMDEIFGEENYLNDIYWYYYNKLHGATKKVFPRATDIILYYAKDKSNYTFYHITEERDKPVKKLKYHFVNGKIVNDKDEFGKTITYTSTEKQIDNVWKVRALQPADNEEWFDYSTQKPIDLIERVILASSNENDIIADFFAGSGTTAIAAQKHNRKFIVSDVGLNAIQVTRDRLKTEKIGFNLLKVKDGIDLFRNPQQTMDKLATIIPGLSTKHEYGKFWFGAITENGEVCPCWVPNLLDKTQAILNTSLFAKILDETAKLDGVSKVVICSVDKKDDKEIEKMIADYDLRDREGKRIEFIFKDLKELIDLLIHPDIVEYALKENDGKYTINIDKFLSDTLIRKIEEFNAKKQNKGQQAIIDDEDNNNEEKVPAKITISDSGLELIEFISMDCSNKEGIWHSDEEIKIDKRGYTIINGKKTKEFWDGAILSSKKPLRLKIRNIAGDETVVSLK